MTRHIRHCIVLAALAVVAVPAAARAQLANVSPAELGGVERFLRGSGPQGSVRICDARALTFGTARVLVVALDYGGVTRCNWIVRLATEPALRTLDEFEAVDAMSLSIVIRDLDQDGRQELIVPTPFSPYEGGARCRATAPVIYSCGADACVNTRGQHMQYLSAQLEERQRQLATPGDPVTDARSGRVACLTMERDRLIRDTGRNPRAGLDVVDVWLQSNDPVVRRRAISVLADINDPDARSKLELASSDADESTRELARRALGRR